MRFWVFSLAVLVLPVIAGIPEDPVDVAGNPFGMERTIGLTAASLDAVGMHTDGPNQEIGKRAPMSIAHRQAAVRQESLGVLRDGIRMNLREIRPGGKDLELIAADLYAHHRIIGLGEASHGIDDVLTLKAELIKALVRCGARNLVIELGVTGAEFLDDYVCGKVPGDIGMAEVMERSRIYSVWKVQEVADLILWIRAFNLQHPARPHSDPRHRPPASGHGKVA